MIETVYRITHKGLSTLIGEDAKKYIEENMKEIAERGEDTPYIFYDDKGRGVYLLRDTSPAQELTFPQPDDYGTTSPELYSMAKTYLNAVARLIEKRLKKPLTLLDQIRKVGAVIGPIVILAALTFILAIAMEG